METARRVDLSIVLGSYNRLPFLKSTIRSIRNNGIACPYEIIVVDGGSTDGSLTWLSRQKDIITIIQHNRGSFGGRQLKRRSWGYFMNLAFKCAQGEYLIMISDDCLLIPGSVMNAMQYARLQRNSGRNIGALAFYWRNWPDQKDYWVGLTLGGKMFVNHGLYWRDALERVGWIEEERYFFYHADGDLCLKLWEHNYEVIDCPNAFVEHFNHANETVRQTNAPRQSADWEAYLKRWTGVFYKPESPDTGGWIHLSYADPHATAKQFPKQAILRHFANSSLSRAARLKKHWIPS